MQLGFFFWTCPCRPEDVATITFIQLLSVLYANFTYTRTNKGCRVLFVIGRQNSNALIGPPLLIRAANMTSQVLCNYLYALRFSFSAKWPLNPPCLHPPALPFVSRLVRILLLTLKNRQYGPLTQNWPRSLQPPPIAQGRTVQAVFVARSLSTNRGHSSTPILFVTRKSFPTFAGSPKETHSYLFQRHWPLGWPHCSLCSRRGSFFAWGV